MIDSGEQINIAKFRPFEGMWLAAKPSHAVTYAKMVNGRLLIPYSLDERKLAGHYYDCRVIGGTLYCRFEHFDSARSGVTFLAIGPNETLQGGRWAKGKISDADQQDPSRWSETLPGMQPVVWVRILKKQMPPWAENILRKTGLIKFNALQQRTSLLDIVMLGSVSSRCTSIERRHCGRQSNAGCQPATQRLPICTTSKPTTRDI